jgi:type I restriction enzyme S subunit
MSPDPSINRNVLHRLPVHYPDLKTQCRIASILGAYDDLIEVNRRRITVLEEIAQRIFDEWFVHFRFPGHEGHGMNMTTHGQVPEGWQFARLDEVYETASGGTPSRKHPEYFEGDIRWVKTKELLNGPVFDTEEKITPEGLANSSAKLFPKDTVLIAMYGANIGQLGVLTRPAATNQACCAILTSKGYGWAYAYLALSRARQRIISLRAGAAQQNVSQTVIRSFPLLQPPKKLVANFEQHAATILSMSFLLHKEIANLRTQRDLLLPRLISGELTVGEAERELESAA